MKVKPRKLYLIADGPKNDDDRKICDITRKVIQKINWESSSQSGSPYAKENILQYNRDNPSESYCHLANLPISDDTTIKDCRNSDCINSCGNDLYSHCEKISNFCSENKLNYLSGGSLLRQTKCSGENNCVDKYWKNIQTIKNFYDEYYSNLIKKNS